MPTIPAAMVFRVLVAALNARGISESVKSNLVMTIIEVTALVHGRGGFILLGVVLYFVARATRRSTTS